MPHTKWSEIKRKKGAMTEAQAAVVFEEWKRRYDEDPEGFQSHEAFQSEAPQSYGEGAARYFLALMIELEEGAK